MHIARNYCTPVDVTALRQEFARIRAAVREEFAWLYGTTCDRCGGPATIQYTIWSDVFECGRYGEELVLWELAVDQLNGKVLESFTCPTCGAAWRKRDLRWLRSQPVVTNYECGRCKPRVGQHPITETEQRKLAEIEAQDIPYWYPTTPFLAADWEMWRGVHRDQGITDVSKFFTTRNLWALARRWSEFEHADQQRVREVLQFAFTGISTRLVSKLTGYQFGKRGNVPIGGTLYVASFVVERNVWDAFSQRVGDVIKQWPSLPAMPVATTIGSATHLHSIPDAQIDYIFTDPRVVEAIAAFLAASPPAAERTLQGLWNHALYDMLREDRVQVSMAQVGELLPHYFKVVDGCWYLRGEAVLGGNVFDLKSDTGALTWLGTVLADQPQTSGELIPRWQQETAHLAADDPGRLERLLQQNFWHDPRSGKWRMPTESEREKMSARQSLADEAHLRTVRRFLDGALERRPSDRELAEWLRFCYRRAAYAEAVALFPHIHPEQIEPARYAELKKIVAVCRIRTGA